jgi:hypothetical protein
MGFRSIEGSSPAAILPFTPPQTEGSEVVLVGRGQDQVAVPRDIWSALQDVKTRLDERMSNKSVLREKYEQIKGVSPGGLLEQMVLLNYDLSFFEFRDAYILSLCYAIINSEVAPTSGSSGSFGGIPTTGGAPAADNLLNREQTKDALKWIEIAMERYADGRGYAEFRKFVRNI